MRKLAILSAVLFALSIPAVAQDSPKAEIFGGVSYMNAKLFPVEHGVGFQASASGNFTEHFGLTADFGGHFRSVAGVDFQTFQYMVGPRAVARNERATGFVHALFGVAQVRVDTPLGSSSVAKFAMGFGGGVDLNINDRVAFRAGQVDYIPALDANEDWRHNIRVGVGFVIKLGQQ